MSDKHKTTKRNPVILFPNVGVLSSSWEGDSLDLFLSIHLRAGRWIRRKQFRDQSGSMRTFNIILL